MKIALLHKHYDEKHLSEVAEEMKKLGAPVIKAVYVECMDLYAALEGCHRVRAAASIGLTPIIDEVSAESLVSDLGLDIQDATDDMIACDLVMTHYDGDSIFAFVD